MIFGNPYLSLQESPAISPLQLYQKHHWADNCGAWLPMPTVPGLYPATAGCVGNHHTRIKSEANIGKPWIPKRIVIIDDA